MNPDRKSAEIIQFPAGGRAGLNSRRAETGTTQDYVMPRFASAVSGGAWYHEEAVREGERGQDH